MNRQLIGTTLLAGAVGAALSAVTVGLHSAPGSTGNKAAFVFLFICLPIVGFYALAFALMCGFYAARAVAWRRGWISAPRHYRHAVKAATAATAARYGQEAAEQAAADYMAERESPDLSLAEAREFQQAVDDFRAGVQPPASFPWTPPGSPPVEKVALSGITQEFPVTAFGVGDGYAHRTPWAA